MIGILLVLALFPLLGYGITLFPWPDLPSEITTGLQSVFGYMYAFDSVMPIHEAVTIFFIMAGIELAIWIYNFGSSLFDWVTGHQSPKILDNSKGQSEKDWYTENW